VEVNVFGNWVFCKDLYDAAVIVRNFILLNSMGSGEWYSKNGAGDIRIKTVTIAHISYNGKVHLDF